MTLINAIDIHRIYPPRPPVTMATRRQEARQRRQQLFQFFAGRLGSHQLFSLPLLGRTTCTKRLWMVDETALNIEVHVICKVDIEFKSFSISLGLNWGDKVYILYDLGMYIFRFIDDCGLDGPSSCQYSYIIYHNIT